MGGGGSNRYLLESPSSLPRFLSVVVGPTSLEAVLAESLVLTLGAAVVYSFFPHLQGRPEAYIPGDADCVLKILGGDKK